MNIAPLPVFLGLALVSICFSATAQVLLKLGMSRARLNGADGAAAGLIDAALSPHVIAGLGCYGVSMILWLAVLSRLPLSMAYPMVALGITIVVLVSALFLNEPMPVARILGVVLIVAGVAVIGFRG